MKVKDLIPLVENNDIVVDDLQSMTSEYLPTGDVLLMHSEREIKAVYTNMDDLCIMII